MNCWTHPLDPDLERDVALERDERRDVRALERDERRDVLRALEPVGAAFTIFCHL